jgi:hypothetical protein
MSAMGAPETHPDIQMVPPNTWVELNDWPGHWVHHTGELNAPVTVAGEHVVFGSVGEGARWRLWTRERSR